MSSAGVAALGCSRPKPSSPQSTGASSCAFLQGATIATEGDAMPHIKLSDGAELYYEKHGNGPPLFLVPGLGGDGRFWDANVAALAEQFTVVVHDHRGTARSTL